LKFIRARHARKRLHGGLVVFRHGIRFAIETSVDSLSKTEGRYMATTSRPVVVGLFHDRGRADEAVQELLRLGFPESAIGVATRTALTEKIGNQWDVGAATGAVAGGATGTLLGVAVASGLMTGVGPVIAGGLLGGLLTSAAVGVATGGVLGALVGLGVPEEEATFYKEEFDAGRILVTVQAGDRASEAAEVLRRYGAYDITSREHPKTVSPEAPRQTNVNDVSVGIP